MPHLAMHESVESVSTTFRTAIIEFKQVLSDLPDELRPTVHAMLDRGWFISGEMDVPNLRELQALTAMPTQIDTWMSDWVERRLPAILESAASRFPDRRTILEAAVAAHRTNRFELSVPVLLIQADGMCNEILKKDLFSTKNGSPRAKHSSIVKDAGDALSEVIFLPLREIHGLNASEDYRAQWPNSLNRHEIIHGSDTEYATAENSRKVLSLLDYFVSFVAAKVVR